VPHTIVDAINRPLPHIARGILCKHWQGAMRTNPFARFKHRLNVLDADRMFFAKNLKFFVLGFVSP